MIIDDQWGRRDDPRVESTYGSLPFEWCLESAEIGLGVYSAGRAIECVRQETPDVVLLDIAFGEDQQPLGLEILESIRSEFPTLPVLMFTGLESDGHRELVVRCLEIGANEYVQKAPSAARMKSLLEVYTDPGSDLALYGNSAPIRALRARVARVSFSRETSVLITGESGSGKELVASALHRQGPRRFGPFVVKNCAHSDSQLLDSELFGHEKGAFTGAASQRTGLIEEANDGLLFLDEIGDMPLELQGKLLRVLETRNFRRLGSSRNLESQFQLVCAMNRSPQVLLDSGQLRQDFFFRIAGFTLTVPPLRERKDDILILASLFLRRFVAKGGGSYPAREFSESALARLQGHGWPGNVRELRNVVERAVILATTEVIDVRTLEETLPSGHDTSGQIITDPEHSSYLTLPVGTEEWARTRLVAELCLALEAKRRVRTYKGNYWKAEFMRVMYPECRAASAKGFDDLTKRLTQGPWGNPRWADDSELFRLISELKK